MLFGVFSEKHTIRKKKNAHKRANDNSGLSLTMRILDYLFCSCCVSRPQFRLVLTFGLPGGGKTALIRAALDDPALPNAPSIGFSIEMAPLKIKIDKCSVNMMVVGSVVSRVRPLLESWFALCDAIVFVIDASDRSKLADAATELRLLGETSGLARKPLLIVLNKCDVEEAMTTAQVFRDLAPTFASWSEGRLWFVLRTSMVTGEGVREAFDWLHRAMLSEREQPQCATFAVNFGALFRPRSLLAECH